MQGSAAADDVVAVVPRPGDASSILESTSRLGDLLDEALSDVRMFHDNFPAFNKHDKQRAESALEHVAKANGHFEEGRQRVLWKQSDFTRIGAACERALRLARRMNVTARISKFQIGAEACPTGNLEKAIRLSTALGAAYREIGLQRSEPDVSDRIGR